MYSDLNLAGRLTSCFMDAVRAIFIRLLKSTLTQRKSRDAVFRRVSFASKLPWPHFVFHIKYFHFVSKLKFQY